ncbi:MAG TPA: hypothetical protein VM101_13545, partial [Flavitalea sp.]|nr:hypothetical protein [Flavitalea sp.]
KKYIPWSKKVFHNGDEFFEPNHFTNEFKVGLRLIHFKQVGDRKRMIGAATVRMLINRNEPEF